MRWLVGRTPFHYGWLLVAAGIAANMVSAGSLFWAISLYVPAIAKEFAVERTPIVTAFMTGQGVYALLGPWSGRYIDRNGARRVLIVGAVIAPLALLWTARADAVWQLFAGWAVVSIARTLLMPIPFNWLITRWFEGRRRQAALGVVTVGFGLGGAAMLPLLSAITEAADWRAAMTVSAGLLFAIYGLSALLIVVDRPAQVGLRALGSAAGDAPPAAEIGFAVRDAIRSLPFWLLVSGLMLFFLGQGAVSTLAIDFFDSRAVAGGATLLAISALVRSAARLPLGLAMGRVRRIYVLATLVTLSQTAALAVLVTSTAPPGLVLWIVLWGVGGAFAPMLEPLLVTSAFGVRYYGSISGVVAMISFGGQIFGPIGGALLFDATGSYDVPFLLYALGFAASGLLFFVMARAVRSGSFAAARERSGFAAPVPPEPRPPRT